MPAICIVAQAPGGYLSLLLWATGGCVLGVREETQGDSTCVRGEADPGDLLELGKAVHGGPQTLNPGKPA